VLLLLWRVMTVALCVTSSWRSNIWKLACSGGAIGSVTVRATWLQWPKGLGSRPRLAGSFVSGYSGICFEIKFLGRHRGFDSAWYVKGQVPPRNRQKDVKVEICNSYICRLCTVLIRDIKILRQKMPNSACVICKFCVPFLRIFCATFQPVFSMVQFVYDTGVLSRVSWLVGPLKLRVTMQLTLSLRSYLP